MSLTITSISTCNSMFLSYLYSHSFSLWPSTSCWLKAKFLVSDAKPQTPSVHFKKMHAATSMSAVFFFYHHFGFFCDLCMKSWFLEQFFCCNIVPSVVQCFSFGWIWLFLGSSSIERHLTGFWKYLIGFMVRFSRIRLLTLEFKFSSLWLFSSSFIWFLAFSMNKNGSYFLLAS